MSSILFIHGPWHTPRVWKEFEQYFRDLGYRCHTPALPQHFTLNQPEHVQGLSLMDYLDQLERDYRAIRKLGERPPIIVGHSMGALLAQQLAERVPVSALILLSPAPPYAMVPFSASSTRVLLSQLVTPPVFWKAGVKPTYAEAKYGLFNALDRGERKKRYEQLCYESGQVLRELACWFSDFSKQSQVQPDLIDSPVLTLVGKEDKLTPPEIGKKISALYGKKGHYHALSGHGHMLHFEPKWEAVAHQIHIWLCWQLGTLAKTA